MDQKDSQGVGRPRPIPCHKGIGGCGGKEIHKNPTNKAALRPIHSARLLIKPPTGKVFHSRRHQHSYVHLADLITEAREVTDLYYPNRDRS